MDRANELAGNLKDIIWYIKGQLSSECSESELSQNHIKSLEKANRCILECAKQGTLHYVIGEGPKPQ